MAGGSVSLHPPLFRLGAASPKKSLFRESRDKDESLRKQAKGKAEHAAVHVVGLRSVG